MEDFGREVLAATRFLYWISLMWTGAIFTFLAIRQWRQGEFSPFVIVVAMIGIGVGSQQAFWWLNEVGQAWGNCQSLDPIHYKVVFCNWVQHWRSLDLFTQIPMGLSIAGASAATHFYFKAVFPQMRFETTILSNLAICALLWLVGLRLALIN